MKVIVCEFSQETNSFSPVITQRSDYRPWIAAGSKKEITGFYDAFNEAGYESFYGPQYRAQASGKVNHAVVEEFLDDTRKAIAQAGGVAAICLALHGATQSTENDDVCGYICRTLKDEYKVVTGASCDLHGNITKLLYESADAISGYQTYPHRDAYETGRRCADQMLRIINGRKFFTALVKVPMIAPASGYTTDEGPVAALYNRARSLFDNGEIIDYTIFQMQPWLDVKEGASTVLIASEDEETAKKHAISLAQELSTLGKFMQPKMDTMEQVVSAVRANTTDKPIVVSDFSDSPNAGSVGDDIKILKYMLENAPDVRSAFILNDAPAVAKAFSLGVGGTGTFTLGGTLSGARGTCITVEASVRSLHDGKFKLGGPMMKGLTMDIGKSAVLAVGPIDILVCHQMCITGDIQLYRHFGIEPSFYQLVSVKANTSFRIAYSPIAAGTMVIDSGCASTANLRDLPWQRLPRKGFYPFEDISTYNAADHILSKAL